MKKLLLFIPFILLIIKASAQNSDAFISLNGIQQSDAEKMITQYDSLKGQDTHPNRQSVWINKTTLDLMVALLLKEQQACEDHVHCTDGIRIYFASSLSKSSGRLNNSIIIVSTYFSAIDANAPSGAHHTDYYNHNGQDPLFKNLNAIKGRVYRKTFYKRGEILYDSCTNCETDIDCKTDDPHYITSGKAKKMVSNFGQKAMTTNSEWFDLGLLQAFADNKQLDGIRIYFSRHSVGDTSPHQDVSDKDALILVPTEPHGMWPFADHKDFFDCSITNGYLKKYYSKHHLFNLAGAGGDDNGELCPSHCD